MHGALLAAAEFIEQTGDYINATNYFESVSAEKEKDRDRQRKRRLGESERKRAIKHIEKEKEYNETRLRTETYRPSRPLATNPESTSLSASLSPTHSPAAAAN